MTSNNKPILPEGFSARPARLEDVQELSDMLNQAYELYAGIPQFAPEELAADLSEPTINLETDSRVVLAPDGRIVGHVEALAEPPFVRDTVFGVTLPSEEGRGIGSWLVDWALQRLVQRLHEAPAGARVIAMGYAFAGNKGGQMLLEDFGFARARVFHEMRIDVQQPPTRIALPHGISVRTLRPGEDEERLYRAIDEAFQGHYGYIARPMEAGFARWKHHVLTQPYYTPELVLLAEDGDEIAGFSVSWPEALVPDDEGWLFQLGVRRPWRRRGLALALLTQTFDVFHKRGAKSVGLGVDSEGTLGALQLYERAGMRAVRSQYAFEKELRAGKILSAADAED